MTVSNSSATWHPPSGTAEEEATQTALEELARGVSWYSKTASVQKDQYVLVLKLGERRSSASSVPETSFTVAQVSENIGDLGINVDDILGRKLNKFLSPEHFKALSVAVGALKETSSITHNFNTWDTVADDLMERHEAMSSLPDNNHGDHDGVTLRGTLVYEKENATAARKRSVSAASGPSVDGNADLLERAFTRWRLLRLDLNGHKCWATLCLTQSNSLQILNFERLVEEPADKADKLQTLLKAITEVMGSVARAKTQQEALHEVARGVRKALQADRVMVYRFAEDSSGEVIAEARCEDRCKVDPMLGLCFPATDIPFFARLLFLKVPYRLISNVDTNAPYSNLAPASVSIDGAEMLTDISECPGRWVAGCHLQYLVNMGVKGSMVLPIFNGSRLWGLISAQALTAPLLPSHPIREACALVALLSSVDIARRATAALSERQLLVHRLMVSYMKLDGRAANQLMDSLNADAIAVIKHPDAFHRHSAAAKTLPATDANASTALTTTNGTNGDTGSSSTVMQHFSRVPVDKQQLAAIAESIRQCHARSSEYSYNKGDGVLLTSELGKWLGDKTLISHPSLSGCEWAGLALVCVSQFSIVLMRPSYTKKVRWAGKLTPFVPGMELSPRSSFEEWLVVQEGGSQLWTPEDLDFLSRWCTRLVELDKWQRINNEHQEMINAQLKESRDLAVLAANQKAAFLRHMSHELRTPFNGMIGMLSMLLRTELSPEQMELASTSFRCAADMLDILDDVLLVSKLESNKVEIRSQPFDLSSLVERAYKLIGVRATQLGVLMSLEMGGYGEDLFLTTTMEAQSVRAALAGWRSRVPIEDRLVVGDPGRVRQVLLNLLGNAVKFTPVEGSAILRVVQFKDKAQLEKYANELTRKYMGCNITSDLGAHLARLFGFAPPGPDWEAAREEEIIDDKKEESTDNSISPHSLTGNPPLLEASIAAKETRLSLAMEVERVQARTRESRESVASNRLSSLADAKEKAMEAGLERSLSHRGSFVLPGGADQPAVAYYALSVEDTGVGIDGGKIQSLFKPFTQLDNTPSRSYEGTGLGLTISKDLVGLMGGELVLHSTVGKGSCFTAFFSLPYGDVNQCPADEEETFMTSTLDLLQSEAKEPAVPRGSGSDSANKNRQTIAACVDKRKDSETERTLTSASLDNPSTPPRGSVSGNGGVMQPHLIVNPHAPDSPRSSFKAPHRKVGSPGALKLQKVDATELVAPSPLARHGSTVSECSDTSQAPNSNAAANNFDTAVDAVRARFAQGMKTVLIVDDNHVNRMVLSKMVRMVRPDSIIQLAHNGSQAVALASKHHQDIAVTFMDLFMPEMDGWEATSTIRANEAEAEETDPGASGGRLPIIALTADVLADSHSLIGFDSIMTKPVLFAKISRMLSPQEPPNA